MDKCTRSYIALSCSSHTAATGLCALPCQGQNSIGHEADDGSGSRRGQGDRESPSESHAGSNAGGDFPPADIDFTVLGLMKALFPQVSVSFLTCIVATRHLLARLATSAKLAALTRFEICVSMQVDDLSIESLVIRAIGSFPE